MHRTTCATALTLILLVGSAHASDQELQGYESMLEAVEACSPDIKLVMLAAGMAYMAKHELPDSGTCGDAWEALSRAPEELRSTLVAAAMEGCPAMQCGVRPKRLERVWGEADPTRRAAALVQACDAAGPEPVFTGELADQRAQMDLLEYLAYRAAFVTAFERLDEIGGDRATQAKARFEALVPILARDLVRHRAPVVDGLELPDTTSQRLPEAGAYPTVWITADSIAVDGRVLCAVADAQRDGALIVPLHDVLVERRDSQEALHAMDADRHREFRGTLLLQVDQAVPYRQLREVIVTAALARYGEVRLAGYHPRLARQSAVEVFMPATMDMGSGFGDPDERPPLCLSVSLVDDGFRVSGSTDALYDLPYDRPVVPLQDGALDFAALAELLGRVKVERPGDEQVIVVPGDDTTFAEIMATLDATRDVVDSQTGEVVGTLFPEPILVLGGGPEVVVPEGYPQDLLAPPLGGLGSRGGPFGATGGLGTRGSGLGTRDPSDYGGLGSRGQASSDGAPMLGRDGLIVLGALDLEEILAVILRHESQVRYCYEKELRKDPELAGEAVVKFTIAADGTVSEAEVASTTLATPIVAECCASRIARMHFGEVPGGGIVIVKATFRFAP